MPDDTQAAPESAGTATLDKPESTPALPTQEAAAPAVPESPAEPAAQEPEKWDAARWEKFGHRLMSKAANGEDVVALLKDVPLDDAPGAIRTMLSGLTVAGETPELASAAPPPPATEPDFLRPSDIRASRQYRLDEYRALRDAASQEEEDEAQAEVEAKHADALVDEAVRMLETAGHDLSPYWKPELSAEDEERINKTLAGIRGIKVPEAAASLDDAVAFINSVRRYVRDRPSAAGGTEQAVTKALETFKSDLERLAAGETAREGLERGELATGAGAGAVSGPDLSTLAGLADARRRNLINSEEFLKRWGDLTQGLGGI